MLRHRRDLAMIMTREQGKPLAESDAEIGYAASFLEWMGEEAKRVYGDTIPAPQTDTRIVVLKQPVGVCGGITPWNFPSAMITRKAAPALAAGNTIVCKPAEQTPLSALALAELADRAGIPAGVFQIVTGDAEDAPAIGGELTGNPLVRKIGFTGSTAVGKILMAQCAGQVKKLSLELGGNAPFLVFDDADLDKAVAGAIICKFRNAGQVCIAANRLLVQDGIHDAFVERYAEAITRAARRRAAPSQGVDVGPLIDQQGLEKVVAHVADARAKGAEVLLGGGPHERGGLFFEPTLLTGVTDDMAMSQDETFGPVAGIRRFGDEEEGIRLANDTPYGLAAYFYSRDVGRVWRVGEGLDYGIVGINTGFVSTEVAPFGGMKESGHRAARARSTASRTGSRSSTWPWEESTDEACRSRRHRHRRRAGDRPRDRAAAARGGRDGRRRRPPGRRGGGRGARRPRPARRRLAARPTPRPWPRAALERYGRIDGLVNNAGIYSSLVPKPFEQIDVDEWRKVYDVNVLGMFLATRAVVPAMRAAGYGRIVNIASGTPYKGVPFLLHYVTSKGAVITMTRALAKEVGARRHPRQHRRARLHDVGRRARQPGAGRAAAGDLAQGAARAARPVPGATSSAPSRSSARRTPTSSRASRSWSTEGRTSTDGYLSAGRRAPRRGRAAARDARALRRPRQHRELQHGGGVRRGRRSPRLRADHRRTSPQLRAGRASRPRVR